jgi:phosphosulfolactate synthase
MLLSPVTPFLALPERQMKPRGTGLTVVIDHGAPTAAFRDIIQSHAGLIDLVKFGWGTSIVTKDLGSKVEALRDSGVDFFFGGTLFEKAIYQGRLDQYLVFMRAYECRIIEVSSGTIDIACDDKLALIERLSEEFEVLSEVGYKDERRSASMYPRQWIEAIERELGAGASRVILEARESGKSGICRKDGELRFGLIEEIAAAGLDQARIVFEAPSKPVQEHLVKRFGANVNLANIALNDVVGLETLRLGLRFDTFMHFEAERPI